MRLLIRTSVSVLLCASICVPLGASAQNYNTNSRNAQPSVEVNLDALNALKSVPPRMIQSEPEYTRPPASKAQPPKRARSSDASKKPKKQELPKASSELSPPRVLSQPLPIQASPPPLPLPESVPVGAQPDLAAPLASTVPLPPVEPVMPAIAPPSPALVPQAEIPPVEMPAIPAPDLPTPESEAPTLPPLIDPALQPPAMPPSFIEQVPAQQTPQIDVTGKKLPVENPVQLPPVPPSMPVETPPLPELSAPMLPPASVPVKSEKIVDPTIPALIPLEQENPLSKKELKEKALAEKKAKEELKREEAKKKADELAQKKAAEKQAKEDKKREDKLRKEQEATEKASEKNAKEAAALLEKQKLEKEKSDKTRLEKEAAALKQAKKDELIVFKKEPSKKTPEKPSHEQSPNQGEKPASYEPVAPAQPLPDMVKAPEIPAPPALPAPNTAPVQAAPPPAAIPTPAAAQEEVGMFSRMKKSFGKFIGAEEDPAPTPPPAVSAPADVAPPIALPTELSGTTQTITPSAEAPSVTISEGPASTPLMDTPMPELKMEPITVPDKSDVNPPPPPPLVAAPPLPLIPAQEPVQPPALPEIDKAPEIPTPTTPEPKKDAAPALPPLSLLEAPAPNDTTLQPLPTQNTAPDKAPAEKLPEPKAEPEVKQPEAKIPEPIKSVQKEQSEQEKPKLPDMPELPDLKKDSPPEGLPPLSMLSEKSPKVATTVVPVDSGELPPLAPNEQTPKEVDSSITMPALPLPPEAPKVPEDVSKVPAPEQKEPEQKELASLPSSEPSAEPAPGGAAPDLRVVFNATETAVPLSMQEKLNAVADRLQKEKNLRVTIMAYAGGADESGASFPKRVSLARGVAIRNQIGDRIASKFGEDASRETLQRMNVKAMGSKNAGGEPDRVDVFVVQ